MPSSSLVEVGVEFEVGLEVGVKVRAHNYFFGVCVMWLGGWVAGENGTKTISS